MKEPQSLPIQLATMSAGAILAGLLGPMAMDGSTDSVEVFESAGRWLTSPLGYISTLGTLAASTAMSYTRLLGIPRRVVVREVPRVKYKWSVPIGRTHRERWVYHNFITTPHVKVGGATGSGKTAAMRAMIAMLCMMHDDIQVYIIDFKRESFSEFKHLPQVVDVYWDYEQALAALKEVKEEMLARASVNDMARYNFQEPPYKPHVFVVVDEGGELSSSKTTEKREKEIRTECMNLISSLARLGRSPGIHVIFGTQRPSSETLPVDVRGQLEGTLAFRVENELDSKVILRREKAAELLPAIKGRMIYKSPSTGEIECQGVYVPDDVIERWIRSRMSQPPGRGTTLSLDAPYIEVSHRGQTIRVDNTVTGDGLDTNSSTGGGPSDWG